MLKFRKKDSSDVVMTESDDGRLEIFDETLKKSLEESSDERLEKDKCQTESESTE